MHFIDLRSDTVTRPTAEMRRAMAAAEVGDDVYGEDPTVNRLEETAASLLGKEAALFVATGTQSNLLALLCHCRRGDEYLSGLDFHIYRYEGGGGAALAGVQPRALPVLPDGTIDLALVEQAVNPPDHHFPPTRLLSLENTHAGIPLPDGYLPRAGALAVKMGLSLHLDGARIWNAAVATGTTPAQIAAPCCSVSACLSKGLGAPAGSLLCGPRDFIAAARRWRKVLGGGMRQAGVLAAAGLTALANGCRHLEDDHAKARALANGLMEIDRLRPFVLPARTNMVLLPLPPRTSAEFRAYLARQGILAGGRDAVRMVTHRDVSPEQIPAVIAAAAEFAATLSREREGGSER